MLPPQKGKVFTLMSTMHLSKREEVGSETKPEVILYNNSATGAVGTMDQLVRSTKRYDTPVANGNILQQG